MTDENLISLQIDEEGFLNEVYKLANAEDFMDFLSLCANNITMSFRNQIFLYKQAKNIINACGAKARIDAGKQMYDNLATATVLYYNLKLSEPFDFISEYYPIKVVGDIPEAYKEDLLHSPIPDLVAQSGIVVEEVPRSRLRHPTQKADFSMDKNLIWIADNLTREQHAEVLVATFARMCLESNGIMDKIIQPAVIYVVSKYFKMEGQRGIKGHLFQQAFSYDKHEFAEFLETISLMSFSVIESLIGQLLSFDETSIVNAYLEEENLQTFVEELVQIKNRIDDDVTEKILTELIGKINNSTMESMEHLLMRKEATGAVYTYPPFRFQRQQEFLDY